MSIAKEMKILLMASINKIAIQVLICYIENMESRFAIPKYPNIKKMDGRGKSRLIVVGDVHGKWDLVVGLFKKVRPTDRDIVVFTGDFMDRGSHVVEIVKFLYNARNKIFTVMGNHEEKHIRWRRHVAATWQNPNYKIPMRMGAKGMVDNANISDEAFEWMAGLPAIIRVHTDFGDRLIMHAGVIPGIPPENTKTNGLIRIQWVDRTTLKPLKADCEDGIYSQPEHSTMWYNHYSGKDRIIYGHTVVVTPKVVNNTYGVDTGAVFGFVLTAYVENLSTGEVEFMQFPSN